MDFRGASRFWGRYGGWRGFGLRWPLGTDPLLLVIGYLAGPSGGYLRLLAVYVSLLANIGVLYHKTGLKSSENRKNVHDSKFVLSPGAPGKDIGTGLVKREAYQVFKDVACLTEILQVKCFGGFISYLVNSEAYLV